MGPPSRTRGVSREAETIKEGALEATTAEDAATQMAVAVEEAAAVAMAPSASSGEVAFVATACPSIGAAIYFRRQKIV